MLSNKIVARFKNGSMLKGITTDFNAEKPVFHIQIKIGDKTETREIRVDLLKAIFFVKDFTGRKEHQEKKNFDGPTSGGIKIKVFFIDGEILVGTTNGYKPDKIGFWLFPVDRDSNNLRIFVINSAIKGVKVGAELER